MAPYPPHSNEMAETFRRAEEGAAEREAHQYYLEIYARRFSPRPYKLSRRLPWEVEIDAPGRRVSTKKRTDRM